MAMIYIPNGNCSIFNHSALGDWPGAEFAPLGEKDYIDSLVRGLLRALVKVLYGLVRVSERCEMSYKVSSRAVRRMLGIRCRGEGRGGSNLPRARS